MTIFHISGNQGSGKTTLGNKLKALLGNKVINYIEKEVINL